MGNRLSGGQKLRVLLAGALYKRPKVLLLAEATSARDVALEQAVNANVARLGITRIIVAHRPETIASAGRLVVLRTGQVVYDAPQIPDQGYDRQRRVPITYHRQEHRSRASSRSFYEAWSTNERFPTALLDGDQRVEKIGVHTYRTAGNDGPIFPTTKE